MGWSQTALQLCWARETANGGSEAEKKAVRRRGLSQNGRVEKGLELNKWSPSKRRA